jgi:hypothetical protein
MKGTGAGWDSCLYRIFIVGGFLFVIASTVITAILTPDDGKMALYVGIGAVSVFMVLIVGYWVVQIIFMGYGGMKAPEASQRKSVSDLSVLQSWDTLFNSMVTEGGDPEALKQAVKTGNSSLKIWFLWAAVIALCPIAMMIPYVFGFVEWTQIRYAVLFYIGIVVAMSFLSFFLGSRGAKAGEEAVIAPLGLKLTELPTVGVVVDRPRVRGQTSMEGTRHGRAVKISVDAGGTATIIQYPTSNFLVKSRAGDLQAQAGAPHAVEQAVKGLRKAKRWDGLEVVGDRNGITASRRDYRGQNLWLYDLWLIERIINEIETQGRT